MTFGMDIRWRKKAIDSLGLPPGSLVLDVACGTGDFCRALQERECEVIGTDFSAGMLAAARTNAALIQADALRLPLRSEIFSGITCGFALRNVVDISALFDEFARLLATGGRVAALEVAEPEGRLLRVGHRFYFRRVVPLIGGLLSDRAAYSYLPQSTAYLPATLDLLELIAKAGFEGVESHKVGLGAAQIITGTRA
jgi:demethylmenaquinone methyltransferase / 2-methoxy-6-polyprenyl-1,4-benzoquinol methylase